MQPRDTTRLASDRFDLLVIGGGIHGLAIAYEASSRGLRTALIEAVDFGSGISFNHQKTVHGGLRALQSLRLDLAREGIVERRTLARIAPWLLRPLPFVMGTYRAGRRGRIPMRIGLAIERQLARDRNAGLPRDLHLPASTLLSRRATTRAFPGIDGRGLTGGARWYDYQMVENDRLTLAFATAADRAGCVLGNYVEAIGSLREAGRISGVHVRDVETGDAFPIRAIVTVNAAGTRAGEVMRWFGASDGIGLLAAMNLVVSRPPLPIALAAPSRRGRFLTLVPWRRTSIIGTSHSERLVAPDARQACTGEISAFIAEANEAFPELRLARDEVTLVHRGLVPAAPGGRRPELLGRPIIRDHGRDGAPGAISVIGVKYTTARRVAELAVDTAAHRIGRRMARSTTAVVPLPGADLGDHEARANDAARSAHLELDSDVRVRLARVYAERAADIVRLMAERPDLRGRLGDNPSLAAAEVVFAVREEMARRLTDIVLRRTGIGAAGHPGTAVLLDCARVAARELGWNDQRMRDEIAAVERTYVVP